MKRLNIEKSVERILKLAGEEYTVVCEGVESKVRAIIQPMRYKNKLYIEMPRGELGIKDTECFLYLGSPSVNFSGKEFDTIIVSNDRSYNVSRAEQIKMGDRTVYIWAVLSPRIEGNVYDID